MRPSAPVVVSPVEADPLIELEDEAQPALALVMDPPALQDAPVDFPRDPRMQAAYWGLQGPRVTYFYQRIDDRYGSDWYYGTFGDRYRRHTIQTQVGTSVR